MNGFPDDWYWIVGAAGDETRVFSSRRRAFVAADYTDYLAWREAGGLPSRIASEAELAQIVNRSVRAAIAAVEARQARPLRDIALNVDVAAASERLQALEDEIAALRATLLTAPLP